MAKGETKPFYSRPIGCPGCLGIAVLIVLGLVVLMPSGERRERGGGPDAGDAVPASPVAPTPTLSEAVAERGACQVLSELFAGNPSPERIERAINPVMAMYDLDPTDDNRLRIGSVLLKFHETEGIPEILLLEYMARHPLPGVTFPEAAALMLIAYQSDHPE